MVYRLFTAHVFGGFCSLSPEGMVVNGWAVDESVGVCEPSRDAIVGIELFETERALIVGVPDMESFSARQALLMSRRIDQLQPCAGEG